MSHRSSAGSTSRCTHCRRQIQPEEKKLNYQDQPFHSDCFVCEHCRNPLGTESFVKRDEKRYCQKCFERLFAKTCNACGDTIKTASVDYEGNAYHSDCFVCSECRNALAGKKFHKMGRKLVCKACYRDKYAKICDYCKQVIEANIKFVVDDEKTYHRECFTCSKCSRPIDGEKYNVKGDKRICLKCPA
ncbi:four and a half LIM domains protein 2-like [Dendronephthya gigantea]|uniref:four and a half LIM domains protein 2-like n=1 Tax=Dendronephthya gigantea TaxID=151771 RepID=UPI00106B2B24|nr:four and a half LIM domains protein 2-like [Dendronephthya gigantea]